MCGRGYIVYIACVLVAFNSLSMLAGNRSERIKPQWITQALPESKSETYIFVRGHGEGTTLAGAKQQAFVSMSQMLELERGLTINTSLQVCEQLSQTSSSYNTEYQQEIILDVTERGHQLKIVCREIDEYWEITKDNRIVVDVLYTVADKSAYGGSYNDKITVTSNYGAAGLLSIIPSVGQFYKGDIVKGCIILGGEIAAVGGIIICESTRASYIKKMNEQPKYASEYNSLADSWETGRNLCIGAAGAIYVYNLINAFVTPGAKHVIVKKGTTTLSASPHIDNQVVGASLALRF